MLDFSKIKLIFAIGNHGSDYEDTYHNVGFLVFDFLHQRLGNTPLIKPSQYGKFLYFKSDRFIFVKSTEFMNSSGLSIKDALAHFGINPETILVIHDDADIPIGEYRFSFDRGAGGHHGIESIAKETGTYAFWRARIGIQRNLREKAGDYVLRKISTEDRDRIYSAVADLGQMIAEK